MHCIALQEASHNGLLQQWDAVSSAREWAMQGLPRLGWKQSKAGYADALAGHARAAEHSLQWGSTVLHCHSTLLEGHQLGLLAAPLSPFWSSLPLGVLGDRARSLPMDQRPLSSRVVFCKDSRHLQKSGGLSCRR